MGVGRTVTSTALAVVREVRSATEDVRPLLLEWASITPFLVRSSRGDGPVPYVDIADTEKVAGVREVEVCPGVSYPYGAGTGEGIVPMGTDGTDPPVAVSVVRCVLVEMAITPGNVKSFRQRFTWDEVETVRGEVRVRPPIPLRGSVLIRPILMLVLGVPGVRMEPRAVTRVGMDNLRGGPFGVYAFY